MLCLQFHGLPLELLPTRLLKIPKRRLDAGKGAEVTELYRFTLARASCSRNRIKGQNGAT